MDKKAVVLINLGTPEKPTTKSVREYLNIFLSDQRIIKMSPFWWQPILHTMILPHRPQRSAKLYQQIWREDGSPLLTYARAQQNYLQERLPDYRVEIAMSYSHPLISETFDKLLTAGYQDITIIPLYPQYSGTTVGSVYDDVQDYFRKTDKIVDLRFIHSFYREDDYINYYAEKIKKQLQKTPVDALLFSYHGVPVSYVADGDPYPQECSETTAKIMEKVGKVKYFQTFQSKFGPSEWLKPATDSTLKGLPHRGYRKILVIAPGFVADCLETLHELEVENKGYFMTHGGEEFVYLPPFNDDPKFADLLAKLVRK
ncbi:ferrochelatase [Ligilactobacillus acidipiscis]|uniref:ferrochelatase n=1 Tax=Ligilactobacillus acidipiscis TaxID=89059 RepID=UPI0022DEDC83|nr:ferrochelatase [Ligilactobacillus acidipiscis]